MKLKDLTIPAAIIISAAIIGGSLYAIQINKQKSIEKQTLMQIEAEKEIELNKLRAQENKKEQEDMDAKFANELKCQQLLSDLKKRWDNVVGISYSPLWNTCMVKYTENGETKTGKIEDMQDN